MWLKYLTISCLLLTTLVKSREINGLTYEVEYVQGKIVKFSTSTKISTLTKNHLVSVTTPTHLIFNKTDLENIEPGALQIVPKLRNLQIYDCNLKKIESGIFSNLNITDLVVRSCQIEEIASDGFDNMKNIKSLDVRDNLLTVVNPAWFADKPLLTTIVLSLNAIEEIPARFFSAGPEGDIIKIHFHENGISTINSDAFVGIRRQFALYLGLNQIETFTNLNLAPGSCIRTLLLGRNKIACKKAGDLQSIFNVICENGLLEFKDNPIEPTCSAELQEWTEQHHVSLWL